MNRYSPRDILVLAGVALLFLWYTGLGRQAFSNPVSLLAVLAALVIAITVHEANHAWVATLLGDPTPRMMGRVSLNPLRHLDPVGTMMIFVAHFGWGKPVMFNPWNLKINPHIGSAMVAFAGPVANIAAAIVFLLPLRFQTSVDPQLGEFLRQIVSLNIGLAAFNLIPIPPLDGFSVVTGVLPRPIAEIFEPLRQYGFIILLGLLFIPLVGGPDILGAMLRPIIGAISAFVRGVALGV
ncbi:MAG: site-2 protease family protein [Chloroflexota bacterium]